MLAILLDQRLHSCVVLHPHHHPSLLEIHMELSGTLKACPQGGGFQRNYFLIFMYLLLSI